MTPFDPVEDPIEEQLRRLPPADMPPELLARIEQGWSAREAGTLVPVQACAGAGKAAGTAGGTRRVSLALRWGVGWAAAAGLVALVWQLGRHAPDGNPTGSKPWAGARSATAGPFEPAYRGLEPAAMIDEVLQAQDEGVVATVHSVPLRRLRYEFLETVRWKDPRSGSTLEVSVPREEIWILPVSTD